MHTGLRLFGGVKFGVIAAMALLIPVVGARGSAVPLLFSAPTLSAAPGSSGSFDLLVTANSNVDLAGESVELGISGSGVEFTATDANTALPYVFTPSFDLDNGFTLDASGIAYPKSDFIVSDVSDASTGFVALTPGEVLGLVHVSYSVDAGATLGPRSLTIEDLGGGTSTSDIDGNAIPFTVINGTLTVGAVPEPGSVALLALGGISVLARRRGR
jgi:PEP-CTERM motif